MRIDVHTHFVPPNCFDVVDNRGKRYGPAVIRDERGREQVILSVGKRAGVAITRQFWDPAARIKEMDTEGIDVQVLSSLPPLLYCELDPESCLWFSQRQNEGISQVLRDYPDRFLGLATIPLQKPDIALTGQGYQQARA